MTSFRKRSSSLILAPLLACVLVGCGAETEPDRASPDASLTHETDRGLPASPEAEAKISPPGQFPSDFPADIPRYPGATVQHSMSIPNHSIFVALLTSASTEEVSQFYREQLPKLGWGISPPGKDKLRLRFDKEGRTASITIFASGAGTEIGISIEGR